MDNYCIRCNREFISIKAHYNNTNHDLPAINAKKPYQDIIKKFGAYFRKSYYFRTSTYRNKLGWRKKLEYSKNLGIRNKRFESKWHSPYLTEI